MFKSTKMNSVLKKKCLEVAEDLAEELKEEIEKPSQLWNSEWLKKHFNYILSIDRNGIDIFVDLLCTRLRIFSTPIEVKVDTVNLIVQAAVILLNVLQHI